MPSKIRAHRGSTTSRIQLNLSHGAMGEDAVLLQLKSVQNVVGRTWHKPNSIDKNGCLMLLDKFDDEDSDNLESLLCCLRVCMHAHTEYVNE